MGDLIWLRLGTDVTLCVPVVLDIQVDEVIVEGLLGQRFLGPGRQVDIFAGIRYWDVAFGLELEGTSALVEPMALR